MLLELAVAPNKLMVVTVLDHVIPRVSQQVTHKRPIGADRYQFLLHPIPRHEEPLQYVSAICDVRAHIRDDRQIDGQIEIKERPIEALEVIHGRQRVRIVISDYYVSHVRNSFSNQLFVQVLHAPGQHRAIELGRDATPPDFGQLFGQVLLQERFVDAGMEARGIREIE